MKTLLYLVVGLGVYIVLFRRRMPDITGQLGTPGVKIPDSLLSAPSQCAPGFIESFGKGAIKCVPVMPGETLHIGTVY